MTQERTPNSIDHRSLAIGVLSITACILFVGFVMVSVTPREAQANGQSDRGGDYIMLTQQLTNTADGVVVVDAAAKQLILYGFDFNQKTTKIINTLPLDKLRKPRSDEPPGKR